MAPSAKISHEVEEEEGRMYGQNNRAELDAKYPYRPHNRNPTWPFHQLYKGLFDPLNETRKRPTGGVTARAKLGPHGPSNLSPNEAKRDIITKFMGKWRHEVGDDFYPAMRLIVPEKDRDRAMYGIKEKVIGKILVKIVNIDRNSEDAGLLLNWKLPGSTAASRLAGDFAGRCYEVLSKRPITSDMGNMSIAEVNGLLDDLSAANGQKAQEAIFETFYRRMNAKEMMWLIRIILRTMKVGATEKTFLDIWHVQAEQLFNVSSSLRRCCWELSDPSIMLEEESTGINLMECFQPQLAQFQMKSFELMVANMRPTEEDPEFWIEDKLDGERMQLHMQEDDSHPGGFRFGFWSRKGKDYTYLYGDGYEDDDSAITRHMKGAFADGVRNLILDGEMITWNPIEDTIVGFGTLKTAALSLKRNPYDGSGQRPLFRVFDLLYLNDMPLTNYTLSDRREALERSVNDIKKRFEKQPFIRATTVQEIEDQLRKVVADGTEGLVLKNPRSMYRLNSRNDDWIKVKPEYMEEFGEALDCVVIGGYYGSGRRGGALSSFLCGLRVDEHQIRQGADPEKCLSFFKVGGGFRVEDYANIRELTEGKWQEFDAKKSARYLQLASKGGVSIEKPDLWIRPSESVVVSVKAAEVRISLDYAFGRTLRFPRFKRLRTDKTWKEALSMQEFKLLQKNVEEAQKEKAFTLETKRKVTKKQKRDLLIAGNDENSVPTYAGPKSEVFAGLRFCVLSEALAPEKKSKSQLEEMVKSNGGSIVQSPTGTADVIVIADKKVVKVASIIKANASSVIRPKWLFDCIKQARLDEARGVIERLIIPFEPCHMFSMLEEEVEGIEGAVDEFGDSYDRDLDSLELEAVLAGMPKRKPKIDIENMRGRLEARSDESPMILSLFRGHRVYLACGKDDAAPDLAVRTRILITKGTLQMAGAEIITDLNDKSITQIVVPDDGSGGISAIRRVIAGRKRIPRIVTMSWVKDCFEAGTLLDEERYAP